MGRKHKPFALTSLNKQEKKPTLSKGRVPGTGPRSKQGIAAKANRHPPSTIIIVEGIGADRVECETPTEGMIAVLNNAGQYDFYDGKWIYKWSRLLQKYKLYENT
jgi:hypothetical protein